MACAAYAVQVYTSIFISGYAMIFTERYDYNGVGLKYELTPVFLFLGGLL